MFAWIYELTPEGLKRDGEVEPGSSLTHVTGKRLDCIVIGLMVVAIGLFVLQYQRPSARGEPAAATVAMATPATSSAEKAHTLASPPPAAASPADDKSIAVLPFVNMSSDPEQEYFADGITEEILNRRASVGGLKVAARTSAFSFKGHNEDMREIAQRHRLLNSGQLDKADSVIKRMLALDPLVAIFLQRSITLHDLRGELELRDQATQRALEIHPDFMLLQADKLKSLMQTHQYAEARA